MINHDQQRLECVSTPAWIQDSWQLWCCNTKHSKRYTLPPHLQHEASSGPTCLLQRHQLPANSQQATLTNHQPAASRTTTLAEQARRSNRHEAATSNNNNNKNERKCKNSCKAIGGLRRGVGKEIQRYRGMPCLSFLAIWRFSCRSSLISFSFNLLRCCCWCCCIAVSFVLARVWWLCLRGLLLIVVFGSSGVAVV
jgi:hypothetical protein